MSTQEIRAAIVAKIAGIADIGKFHDREKYAVDQKKVREFYVVDDQLKGGFITRARFNPVSPDGGHTYVVTTTWELHYFLSFVDGSESQTSFDALLDQIREVFKTDLTLDGVVDTTITDEQAGIALVSNQPAMFAGVLVHYARMTLPTEHTE